MYDIKSRYDKKTLAELLHKQYGIPMNIAKASAKQAIEEPVPRYMKWMWKLDNWVLIHFHELVAKFSH